MSSSHEGFVGDAPVRAGLTPLVAAGRDVMLSALPVMIWNFLERL